METEDGEKEGEEVRVEITGKKKKKKSLVYAKKQKRISVKVCT